MNREIRHSLYKLAVPKIDHDKLTGDAILGLVAHLNHGRQGSGRHGSSKDGTLTIRLCQLFFSSAYTLHVAPGDADQPGKPAH